MLELYKSKSEEVRVKRSVLVKFGNSIKCLLLFSPFQRNEGTDWGRQEAGLCVRSFPFSVDSIPCPHVQDGPRTASSEQSLPVKDKSNIQRKREKE